jgi:hypothetical protein
MPAALAVIVTVGCVAGTLFVVASLLPTRPCDQCDDTPDHPHAGSF